MELSFLILISILSFNLLYFLLVFTRANRKLPPGPLAVPILGNLIWLRKSIILDLESVLIDLHKKYGPIVTLRIGSRLAIFISDRNLTHKALFEHGAKFSDRPVPLPANRFVSSNQHNISTAAYGPLWRALRRNMVSEILHPSRIKMYESSRIWVLNVLNNHLRTQLRSSEDGTVVAMESLLVYANNLNVLAFFPSVSKYIFRNRMKIAQELKAKQEEACLPLIRARREHLNSQQDTEERFVYSYLDSLLELKVPEDGGRNLTEEELVTLCVEFFNGGTDTTSTALQWIMVELVQHPEKQRKLVEEIEKEFRKDGEIKEEDLHKVTYLKAVVLEGMRLHPPTHFVLPHKMTEEVDFEGYVIPKHATVNFFIQEMAWDEKVWKNPKEFMPERFLTESVDLTGSREIKMIPFGAGRRICPGLGLAMLHLELFVANLVRDFEWRVVEGEKVDMTEKKEFTISMKNPLRVKLVPRRESN